MASQKSALLLGATGLVGSHVLTLLLAGDAYGRVVALGRRSLDRTHPRLAHHVVDFDRTETYRNLLGVDDVFCCLGTTIKQAGAKEAFRKVDYRYPVEVARLALEEGAAQYLIVTALGASARSPVFYSRVKGEVEQTIGGLPYTGVYIFRPSLLTGDRAEPRRGEQISERLLSRVDFLLKGPLRKYRPTRAADVAAAMMNVATACPGGVRIYEPDRIEQIARSSGTSQPDPIPHVDL